MVHFTSTGTHDVPSQTPTLVSTPEGLALKSLEDVQEQIDFRISKQDRPSNEQLDEGLTRQFSDLIHHQDSHGHQHHQDHPYHANHDLEKQSTPTSPSISGSDMKEEPTYVEFEKDDPRNPISYPNTLKWTITLVGCCFTLLSGATAATYNLGFPTMTKDLHCTDFQATIGLAVYALGFGVVPLVSTSFSEEVGRRPMYIGSLVGHISMHLMVAEAKNIQTVIVARFLAGGFGSTGAIMVGGSIADIWRPHERSLPMSIYSLAAVGGTGLGPIAAGWIEMNPHLGWRWIQWIHMILTGVVLVLVIAVMKETRSTILLTRLARKIRKETGDHRYRARAEDEEGTLRSLIYISCTRPLYLLFTEPVLMSISIWVGFAWGILYCLIESVGPIFKNLHHFNQGDIGTAFLGIVVGSFLGFFTNIIQERLYQKHFLRKGPEARLYAACGAAFAFPIGMFIYAWSALPQVPWIALIIGMTIFIWAAFTIYLAVFTYSADCYGPFASSASAGQSLLRNVMGMAFPLFTQQMFNALTYTWANTLFACVSLLMIPIPYVLFFYGPKIRAKSKFARMILEKPSHTS